MVMLIVVIMVVMVTSGNDDDDQDYNGRAEGMSAVAAVAALSMVMMVSVGLRQVGLLKNLKSPNIVKLHTCFLDGNVLWVVMDWVDGGDLKGDSDSPSRSSIGLVEY